VVNGREDVSLSESEMGYIRNAMGREPNPLELGMLDIMFSEHCSYKSSRPILKLLPGAGKRVVVGQGYDAGVMDVDDGWVVNIRMESHNHPSAIEPYNGAATGIGGIIRDVLCQGARPIALVDSLRFGPLKSARSRWLFKYVVKGIGDYGNCTGIPTVAGEVEFDESFENNCLVNVACIGLARKENLVLAKASHPGDLLILVGGSTGRDGIHGVTFASKVLTDKSEEDRPSVQIGDPFTKKRIVEGTLKAIETGYVRGLKDLGGGGLTCAASEMAAKGGCGAEIDISKMHLREEGMTPYEIMLSESQERMLFAVKDIQVTEVFDRYETPYAVVGKVTDSKYLVVKHGEKMLARVPAELLADPPTVERRAIKPLVKLEKTKGVPRKIGMLEILSSQNIASKEWVYRQYDHEVGVRTITKPGDGDSAVMMLPNEKALAIAADCNSGHAYLDPYIGGSGAVAESCRNVAATGGEPLAIVDCCNFGDPEKPELFWQFKEAVKGIADMCTGLEVPCIGGNVSFYNESSGTGKAVKPCPAVVALGLVNSLDHITPMQFQKVGDAVLILGETHRELGGSEYYRLSGIDGGEIPKIDASREKRSIDAVLSAIKSGSVSSCHDCSRGGLGVALAIMAIRGGLGATIELEKVPFKDLSFEEVLFSETHSRFILTSEEENVKALMGLLETSSVPFARIGKVSTTLTFRWQNEEHDFPIDRMTSVWENVIPKYMEGGEK